MRRFSISLILFGLAAGPLCAGQVNWGNPVGKVNVTSTGQPLPDGFIFHLGRFPDGFVPTAANIAEWPAHWRAAAMARYDAGKQALSGITVVEEDTAAFPEAAPMWMWGAAADAAGGEWILATDPSWLWPSEDPLEFPVAWNLTDAATVLAGQVNAGAGTFRTGRVAVTQLPRIRGDDWRRSWFPLWDRENNLRTAWDADYDGDGLSNAEEFAFGTHPLQTTTGVALDITRTGSVFRLACPLNPGALVTLEPRASADLLTWSAAAGTVEAANLQWVYALAPDPATRRFFRLRINVTEFP